MMTTNVLYCLFHLLSILWEKAKTKENKTTMCNDEEIINSLSQKDVKVGFILVAEERER